MCYPGKITLSRVNFGATLEHEVASNLKLFQESLNKIGCTRAIDVNKLAKCKYLDSLELCQWVRAFIGERAMKVMEGSEPTVGEYNPLERREAAIRKRAGRLGVPGNDLKSVIRRETIGPNSMGTRRDTVVSTSRGGSKADSSADRSTDSYKPSRDKPPKGASASAVVSSRKNSMSGTSRQRTSGTGSGSSAIVNKNTAREKELLAMCATLQKERDFYFNKLRRIEIYTQEVEAELDGQEPFDSGKKKGNDESSDDLDSSISDSKGDKSSHQKSRFANAREARLDIVTHVQEIMYEEYDDAEDPDAVEGYESDE